ncbi:MAG: IMS domain-containing protein [Cyanobacteriota bacterium]|nr:IMS domain-containing protein [Cyanobacteriota bacterium]
MLIPLDYYRILGVPIQATTERLQEAHRDRIRQMPRREYSQEAIEKRKQLIDEAYEVLCDPQQRTRYDANFLAKTYELEPLGALGQHRENGASPSSAASEPQPPSLEIEDDRAIGALLLLQELGEYELVLKLARPLLGNPPADRGANGEERPGTAEVVRSDIVLTAASAYLELGREQWQQNQYENAASSLEAGQALLLRESLFPNIRGDMQADLNKLRPYRILELLALPEEQSVSRQRGLQLLRDMLSERGGIDGTGDDRSGLNVDDFLRFIQQLRPHTTAAEQQLLFEREARRPSAVATYLAVYALIARGFADRKPALIHRAQLMLVQLGRRQDVHLERSICALLLGQTETASHALELSQEEEALAFIRENSRNSTDLLPGLCLYGERWLQDEVFPHFRDLVDRKASLKEYFADEQVQAHLEALPSEAQMSDRWVVTGTTTALSERPLAQPQVPATPAPVVRTPTVALDGDSTLGGPDGTWSRNVPAATRTRPSFPQLPLEENNPFESAQDDRTTAGRAPRPKSVRKPRSVKIDRLILTIVLALLALGLVGFLASWIVGGLVGLARSLAGPSLDGDGLAIRLNQPPLEIPQPAPASPQRAGTLDETAATQIIETWLDIKKEAMGSQHQIEKLSEILVSPALEEWQQRATSVQNDGISVEYEHGVEVAAVNRDEAEPDRATVEAQVREAETILQGGEAVGGGDSNLLVRYELVRQNDRWFVRNWTWEPL